MVEINKRPVEPTTWLQMPKWSKNSLLLFTPLNVKLTRVYLQLQVWAVCVYKWEKWSIDPRLQIGRIRKSCESILIAVNRIKQKWTLTLVNNFSRTNVFQNHFSIFYSNKIRRQKANKDVFPVTCNEMISFKQLNNATGMKVMFRKWALFMRNKLKLIKTIKRQIRKIEIFGFLTKKVWEISNLI